MNGGYAIETVGSRLWQAINDVRTAGRIHTITHCLKLRVAWVLKQSFQFTMWYLGLRGLPGPTSEQSSDECGIPANAALRPGPALSDSLCHSMNALYITETPSLE